MNTTVTVVPVVRKRVRHWIFWSRIAETEDWSLAQESDFMTSSTFGFTNTHRIEWNRFEAPVSITGFALYVGTRRIFESKCSETMHIIPEDTLHFKTGGISLNARRNL